MYDFFQTDSLSWRERGQEVDEVDSERKKDSCIFVVVATAVCLSTPTPPQRKKMLYDKTKKTMHLYVFFLFIKKKYKKAYL